MVRFHLITGLSVLAVVTAVSLPVFPADEEYRFAIKGAGRQTCEQFVSARDTRSEDLLLFGGWMEGYLTGFNQHQGRTYDVTPWQTTELLLGLMYRFCAQNRSVKFIDAFNLFLKRVFPDRLTQETTLEKVQAGNKVMFIYTSVLERAEKELVKNGYQPGSVDGLYTSATESALREYQMANNLAPSGLPDQRTLFELFLRPLNK